MDKSIYTSRLTFWFTDPLTMGELMTNKKIVDPLVVRGFVDSFLTKYDVEKIVLDANN